MVAASTMLRACGLALFAAGGGASPDALAMVQGALRLRREVARGSGALQEAGLAEASGAEAAGGAVVAEGEAAEELMPQVDEDTAVLQRKAAERVDVATRQIAMAREKIKKAEATIQKSRKRVEILTQENATAQAKFEIAHEKHEKYAETARSYRLKDAERASLKGKHLKFDKETYAQRVKQGNFSTYGLWETFDTKQHFGEKTWDILSNHILGLDKFAKNIWNATEVEQKAKKYAKLERRYAAMAAAAEEELLDHTAKVEQAEKDIEEAKATIADATTVKARQTMRRKEARKSMAREKASKAALRKHRRASAKAQATRAAEERVEEEEGDESSEEAEDAEETGDAEAAEAASGEQEPEDRADGEEEVQETYVKEEEEE